MAKDAVKPGNEELLTLLKEMVPGLTWKPCTVPDFDCFRPAVFECMPTVAFDPSTFIQSEKHYYFWRTPNGQYGFTSTTSGRTYLFRTAEGAVEHLRALFIRDYNRAAEVLGLPRLPALF